MEYVDGTTEEFEYTCCGLSRKVDREGIESYPTCDALRRRTSTTVADDSQTIATYLDDPQTSVVT